MPTVVENTVLGYASCPDALCPGYKQERVEVKRRESLFMREEFGGDIPGLDHSTIAAAGFIDEAHEPCPVCAKPRIAALEERPEYPPISGQDPLALHHLDKQSQIRDVQMEALKRDKEMAEMRAQMAEMAAELQRHKGGRPPKTEDGE